MDPDFSQDLQHPLSQQRQVERLQAERRVLAGEEPWMHETGAQSVVDAVRDVAFPADMATLVEAVGARDVRTSEDVTLPLAYVLTKVPRKTFASLRDFEQAVLRHWKGVENLERPSARWEDAGGRR